MDGYAFGPESDAHNVHVILVHRKDVDDCPGVDLAILSISDMLAHVTLLYTRIMYQLVDCANLNFVTCTQ